MLRDLQDETGGFLAYIPLAYHPDNNELGVDARPHRAPRPPASTISATSPSAGSSSTTSTTSSRTGSWSRRSSRRSSLRFGVNDLEGTVVREKIYHEAGAHTAQGMTLDEILDLIRGAGKIPAERDSFYNVLRTVRRRTLRTRGGGADDARRPDPVHQLLSGLRRDRSRHRAARRRARRRRPDRRSIAGWRAGALDVSVISAVEYARDAARYLLLPDLAISCDGPVRSVMLFSQRPADGAARPPRARQPELDDERRAARAAVRERLAREARVRCRRRRAQRTSRAFGDEPHDARLVIGDAALHRCALGERCDTGASDYPLRLRSRRRVEGLDRAAVRLRGVGRAAHDAGGGSARRARAA